MFKNVSILGRLGMSFGLLLALLFGCAGVGVIGLNTMFSTAQYAVSNDMRLAQRAASVERLVLNERRFENRIVPLRYRECDLGSLEWLSLSQHVDLSGDFDAGCRDLLRIWGIGFSGATIA